MNLFQRYYDSGRISTIDDLKRIYRTLAKKIHPDIVGEGIANKQFVKLKNDFDQLRDQLKARQEGPESRKSYSRKEVIELFMEIEATGFLLTKSKTKYTALYKKRLDRFNNMLAALHVEGVHDIWNIETAIDALRCADRNCFEILKLLIESVLSYHYEPRLFIKTSIDKLYAEFVENQTGDAYREVRCFVDWLVSDLQFGSIYAT